MFLTPLPPLPTKPAYIFLGSDTPPRPSTGTAQRGSSGNTWLPEESPHSCMFFFPSSLFLKQTKLNFSQNLSIQINESLPPSPISTGRYYHSRAAKKSTAAASQSSTSAASTSSPRPQSHNSNSSADEAEEETCDPSASPRGGGPPGLPDFMRGVRVFFYNLPASERKTLARYLITYPFRSCHSKHFV